MSQPRPLPASGEKSIAQEIRDAGFTPVAIDPHETNELLRAGTVDDVADPRVPRDLELASTAWTVLAAMLQERRTAQSDEDLAHIGELPTRCLGCGHRFGGSLKEKRLTVFLQEGDGTLPRPQTFCFDCYHGKLAVPDPEDSRDGEIWRLKLEGLNQKQIGQKVGLSQTQVSRRIRRILKEGRWPDA